MRYETRFFHRFDEGLIDAWLKPDQEGDPLPIIVGYAGVDDCVVITKQI